MAVFNITETIVWGGRPAKEDMISWLSENVGEFYPNSDSDSDVIANGIGWQIRVTRNLEPSTKDVIINWVIDITDEAKSTHFALLWIK